MTLSVLKWSLLTLNRIKSYKICFWGSSPKPKTVHPPHPESMPEKDFKMTAWTQCDQEKALCCFVVVPSILTILLPSYMHDVLGKWRKWFCCSKVHQMHQWSWCCFNPGCVFPEKQIHELLCCTGYRNVNCFAHFYVLAWDFLISLQSLIIAFDSVDMHCTMKCLVDAFVYDVLSHQPICSWYASQEGKVLLILSCLCSGKPLTEQGWVSSPWLHCWKGSLF